MPKGQAKAGGHPVRPGEMTQDALLKVIEQQIRDLHLGTDKENVAPSTSPASGEHGRAPLPPVVLSEKPRVPTLDVTAKIQLVNKTAASGDPEYSGKAKAHAAPSKDSTPESHEGRNPTSPTKLPKASAHQTKDKGGSKKGHKAEPSTHKGPHGQYGQDKGTKQKAVPKHTEIPKLATASETSASPGDILYAAAASQDVYSLTGTKDSRESASSAAVKSEKAAALETDTSQKSTQSAMATPPGAMSYAAVAAADPASGSTPIQGDNWESGSSSTAGSGKQLGSGSQEQASDAAKPPTTTCIPPTSDGDDEANHSYIRRGFLGIPIPQLAPFLQGLAVTLHCHILFGTIAWLLFCVANPLMWWFLALYMAWLMGTYQLPYKGSLAFRSRRWRSHSVWKHFAAYFPARLHKTTELPANKKYIFCYHPHGIISHGAFAAFGTEGLGFSDLFPGITNVLLTIDSQFAVPLYRDYLLFSGIRSVSERSIHNLLTLGGTDGRGQGRAVTIVVGGGREALLANPGRMTLILKNRRGFVRMAQQTGADLVPVLAFGENELYEQHTPATDTFLRDFQLWSLDNWRYTIPLLRSLLRGNLLPRRHPLNIVVGEPVHVNPSSGEADPEETTRAHAAYCAALQQLWDAHKERFAAARTQREELNMIA